MTGSAAGAPCGSAVASSWGLFGIYFNISYKPGEGPGEGSRFDVALCVVVTP